MKICHVKLNFDSVPSPLSLGDSRMTLAVPVSGRTLTYSGSYSLGKMFPHCWILTCNFLEFALKFHFL